MKIIRLLLLANAILISTRAEDIIEGHSGSSILDSSSSNIDCAECKVSEPDPTNIELPTFDLSLGKDDHIQSLESSDEIYSSDETIESLEVNETGNHLENITPVSKLEASSHNTASDMQIESHTEQANDANIISSTSIDRVFLKSSDFSSASTQTINESHHQSSARISSSIEDFKKESASEKENDQLEAKEISGSSEKEPSSTSSTESHNSKGSSVRNPYDLKIESLLGTDYQSNQSKNLSSFLDTFNNTMEGLNNSTYRISNDSEVTEDVDECHFLSFEEWKKQKIGKDADAFKTAKVNVGPQRVRNDQSNMNSIGEEMEIELNLFSGKADENDEGKTYKDKFNYASFDCAATIVKTNREAKGASSILFENKDSYLLNQCSASNKFVIIELCQDILVDTVAIGNFEFFSSMFRNIRVSVSDRFPVPLSGWKVLGEFEAENIRDLQTFQIKNPLIWARYLRLEILSHYGNEFYCPLSLVRVHGKTMMEEFKLEEEERVNHMEAQDVKTVEVAEIVMNEPSYTTKITAPANLKLDEDVSSEECAVLLPHLGLDKFLEDMDPDAYCQISANPNADTPTSEPATQESIYKNFMKRLSLLESNATLSLLYIEEQSKLLSDAFTKLERKQTFKFDILVDIFNSTIHNQLGHLKRFYDSFQKETEDILSTQKLDYQEMLSDNKKEIRTLSDELKFQRRLTLLNSVIIICLLVYVIVTRDTFIETEYVDDEGWSNSGSASPILSREITKKRKFKVSVGHKFRSSQVYIYDDSSFLAHNRSVSDTSIHSILSEPEENIPMSSTPTKEKLNVVDLRDGAIFLPDDSAKFGDYAEDTPLTPDYSDRDASP